MTPRVGAAGLVLAALLLAGCTPGLGDAADDLTGGVPAGGLGPTEEAPDDLERLGDVPPECSAAFPYLLDAADFREMNAPADWPDAPAGSTLCMTASGETASASFVSEVPFEEIVSHYESALPSAYTTSRATGEDNGTGYASLDGYSDDGTAFQVRESDAGFVLVLARGDLGE